MSHNVPWTNAVELEFRSRVRLTEFEDKVFTMHMSGNLSQAQMAEMLGVSRSRINCTLRRVKEKYKLASAESTVLPPFMKNSKEIMEWQRRQIMEKPELSTSEISHLIDEWIFDEKARAILKRRILDNITYESIADEFDMSVRQIKNIVYSSEQTLYKHI